MTFERTIPVTSHGRFVADIVDSEGPRPLLVGFHGYAEVAPVQLQRLQAVRGEARVDAVAIQGLHRFYRSGGDEVAASWMTREDRGLMIADNVAYVDSVLDAVAYEFGEPSFVVFAGFSQGASMAYRAAALCRTRSMGVIALGGDVPPDLADNQLARISRVLIGWGARDRFYSREKRDADEGRLRGAGVELTVAELEAGHAWTDAFTQAASAWLRRA